jgi:hypothetical protein
MRSVIVVNDTACLALSHHICDLAGKQGGDWEPYSDAKTTDKASDVGDGNLAHTRRSL